MRSSQRISITERGKVVIVALHLPRMASVVLVGCALAFSSCTDEGTTTQSVAEVPSESGDRSTGLVWGPCADDPGAFADTECAVIEVPLDHGDPSLGAIELELRRRPTQFPERRKGTLVWVEGGPGARGTKEIRRSGFSVRLKNSFDLVGWDPRGTSGSSRLYCNDDWAPDNDPLNTVDPDPDTPAELAEVQAVVDALAEKCLAEHGDLLSRVGTYESAHDLDLIRQALGEEQISLIGSSYGTKVAVVYATLFPDRVRAVVLDGYDDPNVSPLDHILRTAVAFERQLNHILDSCAADSECPLESDGDPFQAFDRLFQQLEDQPLRSEAANHPPITQGMAYKVVEQYLYAEQDAERMLSALQDAIDGDGSLLFRLYAEYLEFEKALGITPVINQAIICADVAGFWDEVSGEDKAALRRELDEIAPRLGWRFGPNRIDPHSFQGKGRMCEIQPLERSRMPVPVDAEDAGPILVTGTTGDTATPYEAAAQSVKDLDDGYLVTVEADHHGAYFEAVANGQIPKYRCLLDAVHAYLIDLEVPPKDLVCAGD